MEVVFKDTKYTLGKKERKIEAEAPASRVKMLNDETKVIGMMAPNVQVMVTLFNVKQYSKELDAVLKNTKKKILFYVIAACPKEELESLASEFELDLGIISNDFGDFSSKYGVNIEDKMVANSLYVIDKEGVVKYKQIPQNLEDSFDLESFASKLDEVVTFKQKGHTHENWMGV